MKANFYLPILIFISIAQPGFALKKPVIKLLAEVDQKIVTTRDVEAYLIISKLVDGIKPSSIRISEFSGEVKSGTDNYILESMVEGEAQAFGIAKVTDEEVDSSMKDFKSKLEENAALKDRWVALGYDDSKLNDLITRHLRAVKLIKYRSETSVSQVSDEDAKDYWEKNKVKFGSSDFESFKSNIKKFLAKKNSETRMKEWVEILKKKHKVKKLAAEVA